MQYKKIIMFMLTIMMLVPAGASVFAEQQGNLPIENFIQPNKELRMIGGGMCQDLPEDYGTPTGMDFRVWCSGPNGVTSDLRGCVAQFHDAKGRLLREDVLKPGEASDIAPISTASWQRFNCYEAEYTCADYESKGCGSKGSYASCSNSEMLRVRTCSDQAPSSVETERCIPWYECYYEQCEYYADPWGACKDNIQFREITDTDCSVWTDKQNCDMSSKDDDEGDSQTKPTSGTGSENKDESDDTVSRNLREDGVTAFYDPTNNKIVGRVKIVNDGPDMKDTHILEMQFAPKGEKPFGYRLSFISLQKTCDPEYPENVHKQFMLKSGESASIELEVPRKNLSAGDYDVFFLTRHKCYSELTSVQLNNYDDYQKVGPFEDYHHVGTVKINGGLGSINADTFKNPSTYLIVAVIGAVIALVGLSFPPAIYAGGVIFIIGLIGWLITYIMAIIP